MEDSIHYEGSIDAFDQASGRHRVQYDDNQWEFLRLSDEGYLLHVNSELLVQLKKIIQEKVSRR